MASEAPVSLLPSVDVLVALRRLLDVMELRHLSGLGPCLGCGADRLLSQPCLEECPVRQGREAMGEVAILPSRPLSRRTD
jgi:hypothetical protein